MCARATHILGITLRPLYKVKAAVPKLSGSLKAEVFAGEGGMQQCVPQDCVLPRVHGAFFLLQVGGAMGNVKLAITIHFWFAIAKLEVGRNHYFDHFLQLAESCTGFHGLSTPLGDCYK